MNVKRQNRRGAETRARILDAARGLLVESGPESLTLRGVAARAELSLGNLQFHFANLDSLLIELLQQGMETTDEVIRRRAIDRNQDVFTAGVDVLMAQHGDQASTRLFFSLWALALGRPTLRRLLRRFYEDFAGRVARSLPPGPNQEERAWIVVALLEGSSVLRTLEGVERNSHDQALKRALLAVASGSVRMGDDA
jgi:AcrR family transcriptional regulator